MGLVADYGSDPSDDEDEEYPDAGGKVVLLADVGDAGEERGTKRGRATGEDEIEETMEFPQHKSSIVTASAADIARETGAELEYIEGKFDAMARVRGIVARLVIRGTDAQVTAARRETQARPRPAEPPVTCPAAATRMRWRRIVIIVHTVKSVCSAKRLK